MKTVILLCTNSKRLRKWYLVILLGTILSAISWLFWMQELRYQLPTPKPEHYKPIEPGTALALPAFFSNPSKKPLFLHFFNPDCPCSRFNAKHFKELVKKYGKDVQFAVVAMVPVNAYTADGIRERLDLNLPVSFDTTLAAACGVYSTPQAVIVNEDKLYFRGNYNKSRYCTDPKSNFAQMALDSLLQQKDRIHLDPLAFTAYGCELPTCKK